MNRAVSLADLEESAWSTRAVGLADLATTERESAEPTGLYLHGKIQIFMH
jgi:hypothetical protein